MVLEACASGRLEDVKKFYMEENNTIKPNNNNSPLHEACRNGHLEIVKYLINEQKLDLGTIIYYQGHFSSNPNKKLKETILLAACQSGNVELVKFLLELPNITVLSQDFELMARRGFHFSELHMACYYNHLPVVKFLMEHDPPLATGNEISFGEKNTPFYIACERGFHDIVEYLLNRPSPAYVNSKANNKFTPLFVSCLNGHEKIARLLFEHPACNPFSLTKRQNAFSAACFGGHLSLVKYFLQHPKFEEWYATSKNAVHAACEGGHLEVVKELMNHPKLFPPSQFTDLGVWKITKGDSSGHQTYPTAIAIKHSNFNLLSILFDHIQIHPVWPVREAAVNGKMDLAKWIVDHPNVQLKGNEGGILEVFAVYASLGDFQSLLNKFGNDPNLITHNALMKAKLPILVYLLTSFPQLDVNKLECGLTLLDGACSSAQVGKVKLLMNLPQIDPSIGAPISKACYNRYATCLEMVRLVTAHPKANPNMEVTEKIMHWGIQKDTHYPFKLACMNRIEDVALYLSNIIDPNGSEESAHDTATVINGRHFFDTEHLPLAWACLTARKEQSGFWGYPPKFATEELVENLLSRGADDSLLHEDLAREFEELIMGAKLKLMSNQKFCF